MLVDDYRFVGLCQAWITYHHMPIVLDLQMKYVIMRFRSRWRLSWKPQRSSLDTADEAVVSKKMLQRWESVRESQAMADIEP